MAIRYSEHLKVRMALRDIESGLPEMVFNQADKHYTDTQTGNFVAVKRVMFQGKERDVALSYNKLSGDILLITLHPLQDGQRERRVKSGRWQLYEPESAL